jgi:hypothetical protein
MTMFNEGDRVEIVAGGPAPQEWWGVRGTVIRTDESRRVVRVRPEAWPEGFVPFGEFWVTADCLRGEGKG